MKSLATSCVLALLAAGCSAEDDSGRRASGPLSSHARARVVIEVDSAGRAQALADVRFLRYREIDPQTADVLAGSLPRANLVMNRCRVTGPDERLADALSSLPERAVLHHLDAGELVVNAAGGAASMVPLEIPALVPYVTGIEYAPAWVEHGLEPGFAEESEVAVIGFGGDEVGPFEISARLPPLPGEIAAAREPGGGLRVSWAGAGDSAGVVVSVRGGGVELRCRTEDDGEVVLAAGVLSRVPTEGVAVAVERWRRASFAAPGIGVGELEAAVRSVVTAGSL